MAEDRVNAMRADIEKEAKEMAVEKVEETAKNCLRKRLRRKWLQSALDFRWSR